MRVPLTDFYLLWTRHTKKRSVHVDLSGYIYSRQAHLADLVAARVFLQRVFSLAIFLRRRSEHTHIILYVFSYVYFFLSAPVPFDEIRATRSECSSCSEDEEWGCCDLRVAAAGHRS